LKPGILYISYDGMLEPLGQSQVLSYLERLSDAYLIHLISFEKAADFADAAKREAVRIRIAAAGIAWKPLRYHKAPSGPATAWDLLVGTLAALSIVIRHRIALVHARSYVPALMALSVKRLTGAKFLFDMRGLWADERVDAGLWPKDGRLYRITKSLERRFLLGTDQVVTLTHASAAEIAAFPYLRGRGVPITVIPTCANLDLFSPPKEAVPRGPFTFGFVGAAGTWALFDEMLACFRIAAELEPGARLLIVNRNEHGFIRDRLARTNIDPAAIELIAAEHRDVPALIARMDAGAAIRKPAYSQIACAPTKLAEYLACGVPCLSNAGIGDVEDIIEGTRVGVVLRDFSDAAIRAGVVGLIALAKEEGIHERCIAAAHRYFSLDEGVAGYRAIYRSLTAEAAP
jgi:glycosyltransferase involved in cell wall biosynthesis